MTRSPQLLRITLSECAALETVEKQLRDLPQDPDANHPEEITFKLKTGIAKYWTIRDTEKIGYIIAEIYNRELVVLAMECAKPILVFSSVYPYLEKYALANNCNAITFQTIRPGLIKLASEHKFSVSHVEMRKSIS
jgi:hypothetical protein